MVPGMMVLRMTTVCARLVAQRLADLLAHPLDVAQVDAAVGAARRAHGHERHARRRTASATSVVARRRPRDAHLGHELADALLDDRALAGVDHVDLGRADVHAHTSKPCRAKHAADTQPT
jgi:hypothetical protein